MKQILIPLVLGLGWAQAAPAAGAKSALDKATMEAYIRHLALYPPQVQLTVSDPAPSELPGFVEITTRAVSGPASEERKYYVSKDGQKIVEARVYDVNRNPFQAQIDKLKTTDAPSLGTPGAPVVLVVFSDFQCGHCAQEGQMLRRELLKAFPTQVRAYFKDLPLDQIHPWARAAAVAGRCVFKQKPAAFWDFHDWAFAKQGELTPENFNAEFGKWAKAANLDAAQLDACRAGPAAAAEVERSVAEARDLGVNSTPTIYLNGRPMAGSIPWESLKRIIEFELDYQSKIKKADEECCALPPVGLAPAGPARPPAKKP